MKEIVNFTGLQNLDEFYFWWSDIWVENRSVNQFWNIYQRYLFKIVFKFLFLK